MNKINIINKKGLVLLLSAIFEICTLSSCTNVFAYRGSYTVVANDNKSNIFKKSSRSSVGFMSAVLSSSKVHKNLALKTEDKKKEESKPKKNKIFKEKIKVKKDLSDVDESITEEEHIIIKILDFYNEYFNGKYSNDIWYDFIDHLDKNKMIKWCKNLNESELDLIPSIRELENLIY